MVGGKQWREGGPAYKEEAFDSTSHFQSPGAASRDHSELQGPGKRRVLGLRTLLQGAIRMNLQLLTCLLLALIPAVSSQGTYEDCCLKYTKHKKPALLRHIRRYRIQQVNGSCNLRAVIFEFRRKNNVICGNPDDKWVKDKIRELQSRMYRAYWKLREEIKKYHGGNITNSTRPLAQGVQACQVHGADRNQMRMEHVSGSMKVPPAQKPSMTP